MSHIETVQAIYAAFGRGDVPAILGHLAADVEWEYGNKDAGVPWLKPRRGRDSVVEFFQALGAVDFTKFEPKTMLAQGNLVLIWELW